MKQQFDAIRSFGADQIEALERILHAFAAETAARCTALVDRNGQLLTLVGDDGGLDRASFASLAAADFAASDQLANLLGEEEFASLYHQGEKGSMYLVDVGGYAIMTTIFDDRTTLGLVRMRTRTAVPQLADVFADAARRQTHWMGGEAALGDAWASEAEDEIDRLFGGM